MVTSSFKQSWDGKGDSEINLVIPPGMEADMHIRTKLSSGTRLGPPPFRRRRYKLGTGEPFDSLGPTSPLLDKPVGAPVRRDSRLGHAAPHILPPPNIFNNQTDETHDSRSDCASLGLDAI
ncbi:predicted protein [Coccidioides posadasii str. Silveira]|uniref:Predicted protein n=2 Tax=Coccidioides posadasii TaxID=199306 RepID=E9CTA1_COCPS|nr:predicted protein [Coccidioides posadasii str. Silveira]KMM67296.1 hypothetical protein CPAG_03631 [Coccidioides posadasii RMSCC 3488]